jgi:rare lipoprotein A
MSFSPRIPAIATVLATAFAAASATALADNGTGGVAAGNDGGTPSQVGTTQLHARPNALLGSGLSLAGTTTPRSAVAIQRLDRRAHQWITVATTTADRNGAFHASWRTDHIGAFTLRAVPGEDRQVRASSAPPTVQVTVFKPARATWYGPGFYGHKTACGKTMSRTLIGVANRTLPCGTKVSFLYKGRTITVPVVDRGPYSGNFDWDLTYGAAQQLGFEFTDTLGAVSLSRR